MLYSTLQSNQKLNSYQKLYIVKRVHYRPISYYIYIDLGGIRNELLNQTIFIYVLAIDNQNVLSIQRFVDLILVR